MSTRHFAGGGPDSKALLGNGQTAAPFGHRDVAEFLIGFAKSQPVNAHTPQLLHWALDLAPGHPMAYNGLGSVAMSQRAFSQAALEYRLAWMAQPENPSYLVNWAKALRGLGEYDEAIDKLHAVLQLEGAPKHVLVEAYTDLAGIYTELDDLELYEAALNEALLLDLENPMLIRARGSLAMLQGNTAQGWSDWEYRADALRLRKEMDEYEEWTGQDLTGKSIRVCMEQGMGDAIMFSRYLLPLLHREPSALVVETSEHLARLLMGIRIPDWADKCKEIEIVSRVQDGRECDYWVPMCSLPLRFLEWNKDVALYITPFKEDYDHFSVLVPQDGNLRVGLCWRGSKDHLNDKFRSMPFDVFKPLLEVPGCTFYSLQAGETSSAPTPGIPGVESNVQHSVGDESGLFNLIDYCHDFADTAAAIQNLDLVITCDTAVAHVAGAIGKPVWIIIGKPTDWRWGLEGDKTDWYPSARLFRVDKPMEWGQPLWSIKVWLQERAVVHASQASTIFLTPSSSGICQFCNGTGDDLYAMHAGDKTKCESCEGTGRRKNVQKLGAGSVRILGADNPNDHSAVLTKFCRYGPMSFYHNDKYIGRSLDLYGEFSEGEVELFRLLLKPGDAVVDAGANIGALTLPLSKIVGESGKVFAFEPQPRYATLLADNLEPTHNVWFYNTALGTELKAIKLQHIPTDRIHAPGWVSGQAQFEVAQITLDGEVKDRIHFIKIDVDGQELEILQGAEQTISRCRPILYVENDKPQKYLNMLPWLTAHNYRVYQHLPRLYNPENFNGYKVNVFGDIVSAMLLCIPQENKQWRLSTLPANMRRMKQ